MAIIARMKAKTKKKILVTGAAGFIGFHAAEALLKQGYEVVGIDSLTDYYDVKLKKARLSLLLKQPGFIFHKLDITNYDKFFRVVKKAQPNEILHLAAQAGIRYSITNPWTYVINNELGTLNVFEVARRLNLPRVVYASSSSVYGTNQGQIMKEDLSTDEPLSVYGATKKSNEVLAHTYHSLYGMEMIGLRFFTVYGRWNRPDLAIFKFTKNILLGQPILIFNHGDMKRSFTHVSDIVAGITAVFKKFPTNRNLTYNLGGAKSVKLGDLVKLIENALGISADKVMSPLQPGDMKETMANCSRAARDLGYEAKVNIKDGINDFVKWFRENEQFLTKLTDPKQ